MKFKIIAGACAALCSFSAFAVQLNPTSQTPEVTFFIGGASAQAAAVTAVAPDLFVTPADVVTIRDTGTANKSTGFFGMSKAALTGGVSRRMLVVYNNTNGSAAGVAQLLSTGSNEAEADVVSVGTSACSPVVAGVSSCSSHAKIEADMALSDVRPTELVPNVLPVGGASLASLTIKPTALQGFGVAVNAALYQAMQAAQFGSGSACVGAQTAACQPSIRRADYASLVSFEGSIKDAAGLLGTDDATPLTLVRRTDSSGTQASSNIFFANNICGTAGFGGSLAPIGAADSGDTLVITEQSSTGGVKTALNSGSGYAIGVMSLENVPAGADTYRFVKIDGATPNFLPSGAADAKNRFAFASGNYPFAFEMTAMYRTAAPAQTRAIANAVITGLSDSTKHDLTGIAYLDGSEFGLTGRGTRVNRGGNNCQPLVN